MKKIISSLTLILLLNFCFSTVYAQPSGEFNTALKNGASTVQISPNPTTGPFVLRFTSPAEGRTAITIFDKSGVGVVAVDLVAKKGLNTVCLNLTGYSRGIYMISISGTGFTASAAVIVR